MKQRFVTTLLLTFISLSLFAQQALIPMPQEVKWKKGELSLNKGLRFLPGEVLEKQLTTLKKLLADWKVEIADELGTAPALSIIMDRKLPDEGYKLDVDKEGIHIRAASDAGAFYALQTLKQIGLQKGKLPFVNIQDAPAFSWRAFLLDVGRNYQPMAMLKEQIDVMAQYKLNVLHFHFTEDIAWRLASKKYPGLTAESTMTRWAGDFYTIEEFQELIEYCKARNILFLPEIDMPGHSAAFKRFFGVDMQSDSGMVYIKELLYEFKQTFPELEILHIGGDEVKITNKNFMPEITRYVEQLGYKSTIGWEPGSNLMPQTWRQLWMGGPQEVKEEGDIVYIDSKHLYINHMDPLETVTTLFHRRIGNRDKGHHNLIGATLCAWPDRAVAKPIDMFYQNALYPSIVTFAERIWNGGGRSAWVANILPAQDPDYSLFKEFEERLLIHKKRYFADKPFPYVKQIGLKWDLLGPFENQGDLAQSFAVEQAPYAEANAVAQKAEGGTVILRHWWADVIQGALANPQENTTWYARTKIWSDSKGLKPFWIGFNNLSRSYESDSPELGTWDNLYSKVWVNGNVVEPPLWKQAGMKGGLEKPLLDEGYSFRQPTYIALEKGWNEVLIKIPVGTFKGKNWQTPVKWMFTFIEVKN